MKVDWRAVRWSSDGGFDVMKVEWRAVRWSSDGGFDVGLLVD